MFQKTQKIHLSKNNEKYRALMFLWDLFRPYKVWVILMLQAPILSAIFIFANNFSLKLLVDVFTNASCKSIGDAFFPICIFVLAQVGQGVSWRVSNIAEWKSEPFVKRDLLLKVYNYVQHHLPSFFQDIQTGTIVSKINGIIDAYDYILNLHHTLGRNLCIALLSVFVLIFINFYIFAFIVIWYAILICTMYPMCFELNQKSSDYAHSKHDILGIISDNIANIFSLFYFAKRKKELDRIKNIIDEKSIPKHILLEKYNFKFAFIFNALYLLMLFTVLVFLIHLKNISEITTGDIIFVLLTCITISFNLWDFVVGLSEFLKKIGDFNASFSTLMTPHNSIDIMTAKDLKLTDGSIHINDVSFQYSDNCPVFSGLNLSIKSGEKIGIVGTSGTGKSTLIYLLLKNYKINSGDIFIGKNNIKDITSDSLREQIALIPQDIVLFHRSIGENIAYGAINPSIDDIQQAAKLANIHDFIESLPHKYDTLVGERGIKISGGQRQRIAIARAFIKKASIIILDEATSSLDTITEKKIQKSISTILHQNTQTVIAVAHRLSTIRNMNRIIVMEKGVIVEDGAFKELLKNKNGYFYKLWDNQTNNMIM
ncbi:MAG: ABC transporter ATP-binding protein [Candidatus Paracaedibacteraceae bacterium]|nr:ABC transporter ATP-binding protein [Candidatus Paracaedibacteraceae bacterium]